MSARDKIFADIVAERAYQDNKWGGPAHDATETPDAWVRYITEYANGQGRSAN